MEKHNNDKNMKKNNYQNKINNYNININKEYKGYFNNVNNNNDEPKFFEHNAHFPYIFLYQKLEILALERKEEQNKNKNVNNINKINNNNNSNNKSYKFPIKSRNSNIVKSNM